MQNVNIIKVNAVLTAVFLATGIMTGCGNKVQQNTELISQSQMTVSVAESTSAVEKSADNKPFSSNG